MTPASAAARSTVPELVHCQRKIRFRYAWQHHHGLQSRLQDTVTHTVSDDRFLSQMLHLLKALHPMVLSDG
jgi:hypothetical protein